MRDTLASFLKDRGPGAVLVLVLGLLLFMLARKADEPLREYGAGHTQEPAWLLAGERFESEGFLETRMVPFSQVGPLEDAPLGMRYFYLHSCPMGFVMNGLLRHVGIRSVTGFRIAGAAVHILGLLCFFWLVRQVTEHGWLALLATAFVAFSNPLYAHADSVAYYSQVLFFVFAPLALWMYSVKHPATRPWMWWIIGVLFMLQSLFIYVVEFAMYVHVFMWLYALTIGIPWPKRRLLWLAAGHGAGVLLHLARNAWHMGVQKTLLDIGATVLWRIGDAKLADAVFPHMPVGYGDLSPVYWDFSLFLWTILNRLSRTFVGFRGMAGLIVFLALLAVALYRMRKPPSPRAGAREEKFRRLLLFGVALLLAAAPYMLIFQQAVVTHHFTGVPPIPGIAVLLAALLWRLSWARRKLAIALACVFVLASVADCRRKEIQHPGNFGAAEQIDKALPKNAVVGMASNTVAVFYYVNRPYVHALETPEAVEEFHRRARSQFPHRPLYFVLSPNMEHPYELLRSHLDARYPCLLEINDLELRAYELTAATVELVPFAPASSE